MRRLWHTLRFRLAAWNAAVVVLTAFVTLLGVRQGVRWTLLNEMDQVMSEDAHEIALALKDLPDNKFSGLVEELERKAVGHSNHGWFVELIGADGQLIWRSRKSLPTGPSDAESLHSIQRTVSAAPLGIREIRVGGTLHFLQSDMARIDRLVLMATAVVVIVAPAIGYWLASRAARTVGSIIKSAADLRPGHLHERLPIRGTGDELDQLAATINSLLDRIAAYLDQKRDFLTHAAHDLRTPLAAIRSSIEVALNSERSREEYQELLVEVIEQSSSLEKLVNQLLLISESEAELIEADSSPVSLDQLVSGAVSMFRGAAEAKGITLSLAELDQLTLMGKATHLRQLINNLIDNAVKYTTAGGRIDVALRRVGDQAVLTVRDTGIGIAPEDIPRIFDRFFRSDRSRTRCHEAVGSGLGLSICKAVVAAHGGQLTCESNPSQGTCFTARLPLRGVSGSIVTPR